MLVFDSHHLAVVWIEIRKHMLTDVWERSHHLAVVWIEIWKPVGRD